LSESDPNAGEGAAPSAPPARRRTSWLQRLGAGLAILALLLVPVGLIGRFAVLTPAGRALAETWLDRASAGAYGRVRVEGLQGDIWGDFTLRRLAIDDGRGPWLTAQNLRVRWDPLQLMERRLALTEVDVAKLTVARTPIPRKNMPGGGASPVSIRLGRLSARVELLPAFSASYGLYDFKGTFEALRGGGISGRFEAASLTHLGDHLGVDFDLGRSKTLRLALEAREAQGGAMAGTLGLDAAKPFYVSASADGTTDQGAFRITSRSGPFVPLEAEGAWTPAGGSARGVMLIAASSRLAAWGRMLGPSLSFDLSGTRAGPGRANIILSASSQNARISVKGGVDVDHRRTAPSGVAVTAAVRDVQRLIGWPAIGAGGFAGTFTGGEGAWRLAGQGAVNGANLLGYRLARLSGPFSLQADRGELTLTASVAGEGGAGAGLVPALLGGAPRGSTSLVFLADGRTLVKSLSLQGRGLAVTGEGSRGLFGALSFRGEARLDDLGVAQRGARGLVDASWTAEQAGTGPWRFGFDAAAKGFSSGSADVDRLTGAGPTLKGEAAWDGRALQVAHADFAATFGSTSAMGRVGGDGTLDLKLNWRFAGPLAAGPIEADVKGVGTGDLTGTISDPKIDLAADFATFDLPGAPLTGAHLKLTLAKGPAASDGEVSLGGTSAYGPARFATRFRFEGAGVDLTDLAADMGGVRAEGSVGLRSGAPSSADLAFTVGPGALLARGEARGRLAIVGAGDGAHANLKLSAVDAVTRMGDVIVSKAALSADGPLSALPYKAEADGFTPHGSWRASGGGTIGGAPGRYGATFQGQGRLRNADFKTLRPVTLRLEPDGAELSALAEVGGGRAVLEARQSSQAFQATATLSNVSLGLLDQDFTGRFDADLKLQGAGDQLGGAAEARLTGAGERGLAGQPVVDGVVKAQLGPGAVTLDAELSGGAALQSRAHLVLPAVLSAAPFHIAIVRTQPMKGDFSAEGQIRPLWDLVMGGDRSLSGVVRARASLAGTLADPKALGDAEIKDGEFSDSATGLKLTAVALSARLDQDVVDVSAASARDGAGGELDGAGRLSLERGGASSFRLDLKRFRLIDNDLAIVTASGPATISRGADGAVKLSGALTLDRADVAANPPTPSGVTPLDVVEINRIPGAGGGRLPSAGGHAPAVGLDVTLKAARGVYLKGRGLNLELSLDAHVTGSTAAPVLAGQARVVRGDYDFGGKRFSFDSRGVIYLASSPGDIRLDLTASREDPSLTAVIRIEGTAERPKITLSSTPVLPTDEVLAQVLFGASASQLSPMATAQMAAAMTALAGGAGLDVAGNLRTLAHLDRLAFGGDTPGAIVSGGKYVTNNVYLEIAGGANGPTGAVEWRVRRNLSIVSRLAGGPGGDSQVQVRWRKDY
jgi:translocation and assembly module TamB